MANLYGAIGCALVGIILTQIVQVDGHVPVWAQVVNTLLLFGCALSVLRYMRGENG